MRNQFSGAVIGSAFVALTLCGSTWRSDPLHPPSVTELRLFERGQQLYKAGQYSSAVESFQAAALQAERDGAAKQAALNWNNVGVAQLARMDFRDTLPSLLRAKRIAEGARQTGALLVTLNNIADLELEMADPQGALETVREALAVAGSDTEQSVLAHIHFHLGTALAHLNRFEEAEPWYRRAIDELAGATGAPDFEALARMLGNFGSECLEAGRLSEADAALSEALRLVRVHQLAASSNILRGLARLRARQGDGRSAANLFAAALAAPETITPRWVLYADRGEFELARGQLSDALADFRAARLEAARMRADVIPADRDRIALSHGLSRIPAGLVDAGNLLARKTHNLALLGETFDAAELDRNWTLRAVVPSANDWRSRLPAVYWDRLARYQALQRKRKPGEDENETINLDRELRSIEAAAAGQADPSLVAPSSPLGHAQQILDCETLLISFHLSGSSGWIWAVDREGVEVHPIRNAAELPEAIAAYTRSLRDGLDDAPARGAQLYAQLFGAISPRYREHPRWLIEPDGALFDLPFSALVLESSAGKPVYLVERRTIEEIPGIAILQARSRSFESADLLAIGDPIYNAADERYSGRRTMLQAGLPRLPSTAGELEACARAWNRGAARVLTGEGSTLDSVTGSLSSNPAIIHFATHIVKGSDAYSPGLIALSLDASGTMGLLGPADILARPVKARLVVLNGCQSARGATVPGAGLMGLTRAWIAAGARAVMATEWDIPDADGAAIMTAFYRTLRAAPDRGAAWALQQTQVSMLRSHENSGTPAVWAAYFLLSRE